MNHPARAALCAVPWLALCACLDAESPEVVGYSSHVREADADIPSVESDPVMAMRIATNAGVGEMVPLRSGFAAGREVQYWDFGEGSMSVEPVWLFRRRSGDNPPEEVGHPDLIDSVPGDEAYSPFRALYFVYVTARYDGERITSVQALEDAIELGLIEEPEATGTAVNWPVVPSTTVVEVGPGDAPVDPSPVYYRGRVATQLKLGGTAEHVGVFALERGSLAAPNAYLLRRQNELNALDEAVWQADLNADGDMLDSNTVFAADAGGERYTSLWRQVDVIVPSGYVFGESRAESDLFTTEEWGLSAIDGAVVEYAPSELLLNRPSRYVAP